MARSAGFEPATLCLEAGLHTLLLITNQYYYLRHSMVFKYLYVFRILIIMITFEIFCYLFATL